MRSVKRNTLLKVSLPGPSAGRGAFLIAGYYSIAKSAYQPLAKGSCYVYALKLFSRHSPASQVQVSVRLGFQRTQKSPRRLLDHLSTFWSVARATMGSARRWAGCGEALRRLFGELDARNLGTPEITMQNAGTNQLNVLHNVLFYASAKLANIDLIDITFSSICMLKMASCRIDVILFETHTNL